MIVGFLLPFTEEEFLIRSLVILGISSFSRIYYLYKLYVVSFIVHTVKPEPC